MRRKVINKPKFLRFDWLKQEKLIDLKRMLKHQKFEKFLNLIGNNYPNLVRVFSKNRTFEGDLMWTYVKGVDIDITPIIWTATIGLKNSRTKFGKGNTRSLEDSKRSNFVFFFFFFFF